MTGLGTQIVGTLVRNELRGTIDWSTRPGGGTEVVLDLDLRERKPL
jgi:two-component sensor histidine kinase